MLYIEPSTLQGALAIPSSKSHTHRAILFASLAHGESVIESPLISPDSATMIEAVRQLGAEVFIEPNRFRIRGGNLHLPDDIIQCNNSGIVLRFLSAIAALLPGYTLLTGDHSIRHNRPMQPLLSALTQLGALATSNHGFAPLIIKGPLTRTSATLDGQDSQFVSALLIAAAFAPHPIELHVTNPGEKPWIDLTLDWLRRLKIPHSAHNYTHYRLEGRTQLAPFHYTVPGDFSSAAFPLAAALLTRSSLTLSNIDLTDSQGDKAIIPLLQQMGARFTHIDRTLTIEPSPPLQGAVIDLDACIDALPILAVLACFATSPTTLYNGANARTKESDRISAIATELRKMGARIEEKHDGLIIHPSPLHGADLDSHSDQRIALSLAVAALAASSPSKISNTACMNKTYPTFITDLQALGAKMKLAQIARPKNETFLGPPDDRIAEAARG